MKRVFIGALALLLIGIICLCLPKFSYSAQELEPFIGAVDDVEKGLTLWQLIKTGGLVMIVLAGLSIAAVASIAYNFMTLKVEKLSPPNFAEDIIQRMEKGNYKVIEQLCRHNNNIISKIVLAGLRKKAKGALVAKEAAENCAKKEISDLWQNISYLSDITIISPMVGLLGTVLGMIQAFNVIAFQTAVVKPILLAGGVSKAMVTTAGGLIVAIPAMIFYAYFRGKVQEISNTVETYATEIVKVMERM